MFLYHLIPNKITGGFLGVDIFFVISGLVISRSIFEEKFRTGRFQLIDFYIRRAKRIFPILFFVVILTILTYFYFGHLSQNQLIIESAITSIAAISNLYFLKYDVDYFSINNINPLEHTWSLGIEEQFYIFYPAIIILIYYLIKKRSFNFEKKISFVILIAIIFSLAVFIFLQDHLIGNFFSPIARAWQLLVGCYLYFYILSSKNKYNFFYNNFYFRLTILISILILIYLCVFYFDKNNFRNGSVVITFLSAFIIFALYNYKEFFLFTNNTSIFLGKISYSIYLWHLPVIYFCELYFVGIEFYLLSSFITLILSTCSYFLIENPIRRNLYLKNFNLIKYKNLIFYTAVFSICLSLYSGALFRKDIRQQIGILSSNIFSFNYFENKLEKKDFQKERLSRIFPPNGFDTYKECSENKIKVLSENEIEHNFNCNFGNRNAKKMILLIGDSHSTHYLHGLTKSFQDSNIYHSNATCLFSNAYASVNFNHEEKKRRINECLISVKNLISRVKYFENRYSQNNLTVIISHRIYYRLNNMAIYNHQLKLINNKKEIYNKYLANLTEIISEFKKSTNVILILPTPEFRNINGISKICIISSQNFCKINKEDFVNSVSRIKDIFSEVKNKLPNVNILDFTNKICSHKDCTIYDKKNDFLFYFDNNHLSLEASEFLSNQIQKEKIMN